MQQTDARAVWQPDQTALAHWHTDLSESELRQEHKEKKITAAARQGFV